MLGLLQNGPAYFFYLLHSPISLVITIFQIWMLVDAVRRREWLWVFFLLIGWVLASLWYYFYVYRSGPSATSGFELPGAQDRRRIKDLKAQIHHLDKAYHHSQLGDIYFQKGKLTDAEACYRAALEREPQDIDTRAHLGQCLLRAGKPAEARPLLEGVVAENPRHEYYYSMMALAETLTALGDKPAALAYWKQVTAAHTYPRAKVQLAELYLEMNQRESALAEVKDVLADDLHAPPFQRKRDRVWVRRAKRLMRKIG
ncbi:MAG TPA: tetratricopeptide repeat protein [Opitutales bacterium]|nr:tetratricopeptide repeat protein [Opitutales bacterium]